MSRKHADSHPPGEPVTPPEPTPGEDVNIGVIVRAGVGLGTAVIVVAALLVLFMRVLERRTAAGEHGTGVESPWEKLEDQQETLRRPDGGVLLQRKPFADLETLRDEEKKELDGPTRWIDKDAGVVHIPIEDAMRLLVRRGLPVRGAVSAAPTASPAPTATAAPPAARPKKAKAKAAPAPEGPQ